MTTKYTDQINKYSRLLEKKQQIFNVLGYVKLLFLFLLAGSLYLIHLLGVSPALSLLAATLIALTAAMWIYHIKIHEGVELCEGMIRINKQYISRITGTWTGFDVLGSEYADAEHPYAADLDITGPKSLFQLLNAAHSWHGRKAFADDLLGHDYSAREIRERQLAVRELAGKTEFANLFQLRAERIGANPSVLRMLENLKDPDSVIRSVPLCRLLLSAPVLVTALFGAAVAFRIQSLYIPSLVLLAAQAVFWVAGLPKTNPYLATAAASPYIFRHYADVLELLDKEGFTSPLLCRMQDALSTGKASANRAMKELDSIVSKTNVKNSGILYFLLNVLLLWDYRCVVHLSAWKKKYGACCEEWMLTLGSFESLLSLAGLPNVCAGTCMPDIAETRRVVRAIELGHPLLPNESRICNGIAMQGNLFIISGSNMSGKTTFLRTVGINLVLARAGSAVCAREMQCSLYHIRSSMRITDDLSGGISTFYAELRLIKGIIDAARGRKDLFFLIDEIFRGTNSEDRLFGARTVIRELSALNAMGIVTTHDLSLCSLEAQYPNIRNYSFTEQYTGDEMFFDYKMQSGKSRTTNARFLMKKVGILLEPPEQY